MSNAVQVAGMRLRAPSRNLAKVVEWRAARIADPVQRLAYLRQSAAFWAARPLHRALADARARAFAYKDKVATSTLGASGQVAPTAGSGGIYKNSKLNSATTADSS